MELGKKVPGATELTSLFLINPTYTFVRYIKLVKA